MVTMRNKLRRCWQARVQRWTCMFAVLALVGCALPRRDAPPTLFSAATPVDFPAGVRFLSTDRASVEAKSTTALQRLRASSKDGMLRALVLSGGGAGGAFGAGALVGLSRRQERPQYDVVTGVSTGALIAPFAFLGTEWDRFVHCGPQTSALSASHSVLKQRTHRRCSKVSRAVLGIVERQIRRLNRHAVLRSELIDGDDLRSRHVL